MPRLNIADKYGSPRYTNLSQTQPDGAPAAARKMTRWADDTNRRRWGEPPRGMTEWDYGPGGRPWGAPANSWVFEQERKDIHNRHGSDQAISDWIARTQDTHSMQSPTGWGEARDSNEGWNDDGWNASTASKDGWHETSEASSRFGYHPLSHPPDCEDQSNGWGGNPKRSRAKAQKVGSNWGDEPGCLGEHGWGEGSGWSTESGRNNDGWGEAPVPHHEWKDSGWDASTGIGEQWHGAQDPSNSGHVPISEHFDHEDQSVGWGHGPKYSCNEAPKGMSSWEDVCQRRENFEWDKDSAWTKKTSRSADDAWINRHQSQGYDCSSGYLLTPSETTEPSAETSWTKQYLTTQRQDEGVKDLRRQLAEEKRKNVELGRRLYTLENEGVDPGSVFGLVQEENEAETAAFEWSAEEPPPPTTPLTPVNKPKLTHQAVISPAEREHFDPPPKRLSKTALDSIASSMPQDSWSYGEEGTINHLKWKATTDYDRYSGVIRDKIHGTRPVFFTMDQTATFGDILRSWKKRRGIHDEALIFYYRGDGWEHGRVVWLDHTAGMEGIIAKHIELDVSSWERQGGW